MNKKKNIAKKNFIMSLISLVVCVAMLMGTTFAWFTDSVTSGTNRIVAGDLDVEMYYKNATMNTWQDVTKADDEQPNFFVDANGKEILWEPGVVAYAHFEVRNVGNLALKYKFAMTYTQNYLNTHGLSEVVKIAQAQGIQAYNRDNISGLSFGDIDSFKGSGSLEAYEAKKNVQTGNDTSKYTCDDFTVVLYWAPNDASVDNLYNVNNGQSADDGKNYLWLDTDINLVATQLSSESDSFDNTYDKNTVLQNLPEQANVRASGEVNSDGITELKDTDNNTVATIPTSAEINLTGTVDGTQSTSLNANEDGSKVTLNLNVDTAAVTTTSVTYEISMTATGKNYDGQTLNNAKVTEISQPVTVTRYIGSSLENVKVTHSNVEMIDNGSSDFTSANLDENPQGYYYYDSASGNLYIYTKSFSPFTVSYTMNNNYVAAIGTTGYNSLADAFAAAKADANIVTLLKNLALDANLTVASNQNVILDLDGKTITAGNAQGQRILVEGTLEVKNGTISGNTEYTNASNNVSMVKVTGNLTVDRDATITSAYYTIFPAGDNSTLTVYGTVKSTGGAAAISMNGSASGENYANGAKVYIKEGANVETGSVSGYSDAPVGIYVPAGELYVEGGSITGPTGIAAKGGKVVISGGSITANGDADEFTHTGDGWNNTGDALAVESCTYPYGPVNISVTGGTFTSANGKSVAAYVYGDYVAATDFIAGGVFSTDPIAYVASGYVVEKSGDVWIITVDYVAQIVDGQKYTTLQEAISEAKNSDTIQILHDISELDCFSTVSGVTIDGQGHRLTFDTNQIAFKTLENCKLKDIEFEINIPSTSGNFMLAEQITSSIFENVDIFGSGTVTGNVGAFCWKIYGENTFTDCDVYATMTGGGHSNNYNAVFFGIPQTNATINMTDCTFGGVLKCGSAAMFVANPCYGKDITLNIKNVKNNGLIQTISVTGNIFIQSPNQFSAVNNDGSFSFYTIILDGQTLTVNEATETEQTGLNGTGHFMFGPDDATLAITLDESTKQFVITPATTSGIEYYEIAIGTYVGVPGGSNRNYIFEIISASSENLVSKLKMLDFVDYAWVQAHPEATRGTLNNNTIYTLNGNSYYLVNEQEFSTNGVVKPMSICAVSAYDADGTLIASSSFNFN